MILRSMLFVPGDSERKLARSRFVPADALILDLEDSVASKRKAAARGFVKEFLAQRADLRASALWVRVNPMTSAECAADLEEIMPAHPDGIVLPKAASADDVSKLAARLSELERRNDADEGRTSIMPMVTETPASLFGLGDYARGQPRLAAMTWGAEDLAAALGATSNVDAAGDWLFTYRLARALCLLAAHAAEAMAIDTVYTRLGDPDGLRERTLNARRDGFSGKLAIHPDQVEIINEAFRPTADEIDYARRVVEAFGRSFAGTIALDGRMLDVPHLRRARRILALASELGEELEGR